MQIKQAIEHLRVNPGATSLRELQLLLLSRLEQAKFNQIPQLLQAFGVLEAELRQGRDLSMEMERPNQPDSELAAQHGLRPMAFDPLPFDTSVFEAWGNARKPQDQEFEPNTLPASKDTDTHGPRAWPLQTKPLHLFWPTSLAMGVALLALWWAFAPLLMPESAMGSDKFVSEPLGKPDSNPKLPLSSGSAKTSNSLPQFLTPAVQPTARKNKSALPNLAPNRGNSGRLPLRTHHQPLPKVSSDSKFRMASPRAQTAPQSRTVAQAPGVAVHRKQPNLDGLAVPLATKPSAVNLAVVQPALKDPQAGAATAIPAQPVKTMPSQAIAGPAKQPMQAKLSTASAAAVVSVTSPPAQRTDPGQDAPGPVPQVPAQQNSNPAPSGAVDQSIAHEEGLTAVLLNQEMFKLWLRSGTQVRYQSWEDIPNTIRDLEPERFREAVVLELVVPDQFKDAQKP